MSCSDVGAYIALLGGFELNCNERRIALPLGAQRLLALLAFQDDGVHRGVAAERLWPDTSTARAGANLRSALWRGREIDNVTIIDRVGPRLRLSPSSTVDIRRLLGRVRHALDAPDGPGAGELERLADELRPELLPDWSDDWLVLERERWDQVRLHLLEDLAHRLCSDQHYLPALQTALIAVGIEPIRETAHRIVIEIHIAEGNAATALRYYQRYRALLYRELGVTPSPRMAELAEVLMPS